MRSSCEACQKHFLRISSISTGHALRASTALLDQSKTASTDHHTVLLLLVEYAIDNLTAAHRY